MGINFQFTSLGKNMQCHCDGGIFYFSRQKHCFMEVESDVLFNIIMIYESEIIRNSLLLKSIQEFYTKIISVLSLVYPLSTL